MLFIINSKKDNVIFCRMRYSRAYHMAVVFKRFGMRLHTIRC